jgi:hypothetical protein
MNRILIVIVYLFFTALALRWHHWPQLIPLTLFLSAFLIVAGINRDSWQKREASEILAVYAAAVFVVACLAELVVVFL